MKHLVSCLIKAIVFTSLLDGEKRREGIWVLFNLQCENLLGEGGFKHDEIRKRIDVLIDAIIDLRDVILKLTRKDLFENQL